MSADRVIRTRRSLLIDAPLNEEFVMPDYDYIVIGGGMTADAAVHGIHEVDKAASIGVISSEPDPPYNPPP